MTTALAPTKRVDRRLSRDEVVDVVAVVGLLACALVGFRTVFSGTRWIVVGALGLGVGVSIGLVAARRRLGPLPVAGLTAAAYFLMSGLLIPERALATVLPGLRSVTEAAHLAIGGWKDVVTVVPPLASDTDLVVVVALVALVGGVLSTSAARRTGSLVLPVVPLVAAVALTILLGTLEPAAVVVQGGVFAAGLILWLSDRQQRRFGPVRTAGRRPIVQVGLLLASVAIALGAVRVFPVEASQRFVLREQSDPPFDPRTHPSPLAGYRHYSNALPKGSGNLKREVVFVAHPTGAAVRDRRLRPLRLAVLDTYDGVVWQVAAGTTRSSSGVFEAVGQGLPVARSGADASVRLDVRSYADIWVPSLGEVRGVRFDGPRRIALRDSFRLNRATGTGAVPLRLQDGDVVTVSAAVPDDPPGVGHGATVSGTAPDPYIPDSVRRLARRTVGHRRDVDEIMQRIKSQLQHGKAFGYSDGDGGIASDPGHHERRMSLFAQQARDNAAYGNGEQYASIAALMGRSLGIETRVVMGFCSSGCRVGPDGAVTVRGSDVAAWVEYRVSGRAWVPLNVTPSKDKRAQQERQLQPTPKKISAQSQPPSPPTSTPLPDSVEHKEQRRKHEPSSGGFSLPWGTIGAGAAILSPFLLLLGVAGAIVLVKRRRSRRRRSAGTERDRIEAGWTEVVDLATDLGRPLPPQATRRESADLLEVGSARDVAVLADRATFGPGSPPATEVARCWGDVERVRDELIGPLGRVDRWRVSVNPASLRRPATPEREREVVQ